MPHHYRQLFVPDHSLNTTMDSETNHSEHLPDPRLDNTSPQQPLSLPSDDAIDRQKATSPPSGFLRSFSKLGNLPEWNVPWYGQLQCKALNNAIAWCSCLAFLMFGYDQGVMSSLLTLDDFQRHFPLMTPLSRANNLCWLDAPRNTVRDKRMCTGDANTQAAAVAVYQVGCFLGAVLIFFYGEVWGRKSSTFWGNFIMIVGTIFQVAAGGAHAGNAGAYAIIVVGRLVNRKPAKRGRLIITSGALIVAGIMISYWVGYGFYHLPAGEVYSSVRWWFPVAFQSFFTVLVM